MNLSLENKTVTFLKKIKNNKKRLSHVFLLYPLSLVQTSSALPHQDSPFDSLLKVMDFVPGKKQIPHFLAG